MREKPIKVCKRHDIQYEAVVGCWACREAKNVDHIIRALHVLKSKPNQARSLLMGILERTPVRHRFFICKSCGLTTARVIRAPVEMDPDRCEDCIERKTCRTKT